MFTPERVTRDGIEIQFATDHLGHFALTGLLLDGMLSVHGSRVVTVSSLAHRARGATDFNDVQRPYDRVAAYGRSKLANLLFTYELARRLSANDASTAAVAAHPGKLANRAVSQLTPLDPHPVQDGRCAGVPKPLDGCPAHTASCDRSRCARWSVLRS